MSEEQLPLVLLFSELIPAADPNHAQTDGTRKTGVDRETTDDD